MKAVRYYELAVDREPDQAAAYERLLRYYQSAGREKEGLTVLAEYVESKDFDAVEKDKLYSEWVFYISREKREREDSRRTRFWHTGIWRCRSIPQTPKKIVQNLRGFYQERTVRETGCGEFWTGAGKKQKIFSKLTFYFRFAGKGAGIKEVRRC